MTADQTVATVGVVIVTHNSGKFLPKTLRGLLAQTVRPERLVLVDSGSTDRSPVEAAAHEARRHLAAVDVVLEDNIGFCAANNLGYRILQPACRYILLLNPDVFLGADTLNRLLALMTDVKSRIGAATGLLLGYDFQRDAPTGRIDSAGIFRTWYGRWYDRHQGQRFDQAALGTCQEVPAICGALMLCRVEALRQAALPGENIFDPSFFMYKEDIDLSLRLRARGWRLGFDPAAESYHCRGWLGRRHMPKKLRVMSARNEIRICLRHRDPRLLFHLLKYAYVQLFD